jgi:hypothetical protein
MVKKKGVKKFSGLNSKEINCDTNRCGCNIMTAKLAAMAFILFLITVWPWAMQLVHRIHWGWFLGATVVLGILSMNKNCWCCKK